jgi:hypothetical protein
MSNTQRLLPTYTTCPDCEAKCGEYHRFGCEVERCPRCGRQFLLCLGGCSESLPGEPWPPPLDDRMVWTGQWPGEEDCRELGWFVKQDPAGRFTIPCGPSERGAIPDLNRLVTEADWDRLEKKFVWTNLTEAFAEMKRCGLLVRRGRRFSNLDAIDEIVSFLSDALVCGKEYTGAAFYTKKAKWNMLRDKDFALHFVSCGKPDADDPRIGTPDCLHAEVGRIVCKCLDKYDVKNRWNGDGLRPIRVVTASISPLNAGKRAEDLRMA